MAKTQMLVMILVTAAAVVAVAQSPQGRLVTEFGKVVTDEVPSLDALDHRTVAIGGQDLFVGGVWGRMLDGGTVFKGEKITMQTSSFPSP